jgi:hypothetical protein
MLTMRFSIGPTVPFVDVLYRLLGLELGFHCRQQARLIPLECTQVVILAVNDDLSRFFGC